MTTLIVSDLHLGCAKSRTDLFGDFLEGDFERLILNGDTVDCMDFHRFRSEHWSVVAQLQAVARERELVLLRGNHDDKGGAAALEKLGKLLGAEPRAEYELNVGGDRYLILHGDQFDNTFNLSWLGDLTDWGYRALQSTSQGLARWVKARTQCINGVVKAVHAGALAAARQRGFAGVITGHTHYPHDEFIDGIHFLNTGCWVDTPCTYVSVQQGSARLRHWTATVPARARPQPQLASVS